MSDAHESLENLPTHAWARLKEAIDGFEETWNLVGPAEIAEFLPDDDDRLRVLRALIHIDLERRLELGETVRLESYLDQFPELKGDDEDLLELIAAEFFLRRQRDARVGLYREVLLAGTIRTGS